MKTKKVVFIDWNRTLSFSLFWGHLKDSGHINSRHHSAIEKWLFVDHKEVINPWMRGTTSMETILESMSRDIEVEQALIQEELAYSCMHMSLCSPDIESLINALQEKGVLVVIATDNMDTFRKYTVPALKLDDLFDDILISSELGILKDDSEPQEAIRFFDSYLRDKGLEYGDAVLLDDSPDSSGKYQKLGFERVLIDTPMKLVTVLENMVASHDS